MAGIAVVAGTMLNECDLDRTCATVSTMKTRMLDNSPRMTNETDHEGEETETANECEDEEDEQDDIDLLGGGRELSNTDESVTRCIW